MTKPEQKKINILLREIMIKLWGDKCLKCNKPPQMSHIKSKGAYPQLKYEPLNIKPLCFRHHLHWWHKEPTEAGEWISDIMPIDSWNELERMVKECNTGKRKTPKFKDHFEYLTKLLENI